MGVKQPWAVVRPQSAVVITNDQILLLYSSGESRPSLVKVGIQRQRHPREDRREDVGVHVGVGVMECITDTDTDFLARILARKSCVSDLRMEACRASRCRCRRRGMRALPDSTSSFVCNAIGVMQRVTRVRLQHLSLVTFRTSAFSETTVILVRCDQSSLIDTVCVSSCLLPNFETAKETISL